MKLLDEYYKRPILYDYIISLIVISTAYFLKNCYQLELINSTQTEKLSSELGSIGLTISGFILTLTTILISLKTNQLLSNKTLSNKSNPFEIFLSSQLYIKSINILKFSVLSLTTISVSLYICKLIINDDQLFILSYLNITTLIIITTTFMRCFYVVNLILKMQSNEQ